MENADVTLKIKHLNDKVFDVKINTSITVAELKEAIEKESGIKAAEQKLIFKGKILKDTDAVSSLKVEDGSAMHLVQTKSATTTENKPQSTSTTSDPNVPTNLQSGGFGMLNSMGFAPSLGGAGAGGLGAEQMSQMLGNPMVQGMLQNVLSNPEVLQNMIQNNPMLRQMTENNPELQQALSDPNMLQMLRDPQVIQSAMGMMNRMNQGGTGTMGGGFFPQPGGASGSQSTQSTDSSQTTNQQQQQQPQQNPFGMFGMGLGGAGGYNPMQMMSQMFGQQQQQAQSGTQGTTGTTDTTGTTGTTGTNTTGNVNPNPFANFGGFGGGFPMFPLGGFGQNFGQQQQQQTQQDNTPPEEKYKDQLVQLEAMGFVNKETNIQALKVTNGNVNAAVERLLNMLG